MNFDVLLPPGTINIIINAFDDINKEGSKNKNGGLLIGGLNLLKIFEIKFVGEVCFFFSAVLLI